jgi:hypothetical protein
MEVSCAGFQSAQQAQNQDSHFAKTADSTHIRAVWSVLGSEVRLNEPRFSIEDRHVI